MEHIQTALLVILTVVMFCFAACNKSSDPVSSGGTAEQGFIRIGTQVWTTVNLNVDHYRNGDTIPQVKDSITWAGLTTGAWCYYNNDTAYGRIYGKLYNWYAVNDPRGLVPVGWHIPSDTEWTTLSNFLGGDTIAGGKMKATTLWESPNTGATNSSGFTALPGGFRLNNFNFYSIGKESGFWSSSDNIAYAWYRSLHFYVSELFRITYDKRMGLSVRCVWDN